MSGHNNCQSAKAVSWELLLPRTAYDLAVRRQLHDLDAYAFGRIRWRETETARQAIVERVHITNGLPDLSDRPTNDGFVIVHVEYAEQGWSAADLIARVDAEEDRVVAGLVVNVPRACWDACIRFSSGVSRPFDALRVVGPEPLRLRRHAPTITLSDEQRERWSRTSGAIGAEVFAKLRESCVNLIGTGRTGSLCGQQVLALAVGQIRGIDADVLESHNQVGTTGLSEASIGDAKVHALGQSLVEQRRDLAVALWQKSILDPAVQRDLRSRDADLFITCVDDDAARLTTWMLSRATLTPHLDIATSILPGEPDRQMLADVRLFIPGESQGCPACIGGLHDLDETLYRFNAPVDSMQRGEPDPWFSQRAGSLVSLNSLAVGAGLQMWLDYLSGSCRTSAWQRLRWAPGAGLQSNFAAVSGAEDCAFCGADE